MLRPDLLLMICASVYLVVVYFAGFFSWDFMLLSAMSLLD